MLLETRVGWKRSHIHWGPPLCQALYFIIKFSIAFIPCIDPTSCKPFFTDEETDAWNDKRTRERQRTNQ